MIFWRPVQQRFLAFLLLSSEAPSEEALSEAVEQAGDPQSFLRALWRTRRIPDREFVLNYLSRAATSDSNLLRAMEPLVMEATADPDITAREAAFAILAKTRHPQLRTLALEQLSEPDPAARVLGLQTLRSIASSNDVAIAIRLLKDSEPRVAVAAALVLQQATGQDFGIKSTQALPLFTCIDTNPPPAPDLVAVHQGVERAQNWWATHEKEFPAAPAQLSVPASKPRLPVADFNLENPDGKFVRLSQVRGRTVLLAFWSAGAPASLDDVPALKKLQQRYSDRLAVVGVCIPAAPSCTDEHEHGHDHARHDHEQTAMTTGTEHMGCFVRDAVARLKINYPMVADPKDVVGRRFSIGELPAYVLIDAGGMVRGRSVGFRTESALAAMIDEVVPPSRTQASTKLGRNE